MKALQDILKKNPEQNYETWFYSIANLLMNNYVIDGDTNKYRITECEFYYYSAEHKDETTYGFTKDYNKLSERIKRHKDGQRNTLTWFFHYSGIDIVIGNKNEWGGILIRAIVNVETKERITGPLVVMLELLNQGVQINGDTTLFLKLFRVEASFNKKIEQQTRIGINSGDYANHLYNFFVRD